MTPMQLVLACGLEVSRSPVADHVRVEPASALKPWLAGFIAEHIEELLADLDMADHEAESMLQRAAAGAKQ